MKKFRFLFLFVFLISCSTSQTISPSTDSEAAPTQPILPSKTLTITHRSTQEPSLTPLVTATLQTTAPLIPPVTPTPSDEALSIDNVKNITLLKQWGKGTPEVTAWSPNGKLFLVGTSLGVYVFNSQTMDEIRFIRTDGSVREIAVSPDSKVLAINSGPRTLWDLETGRLINKVPTHIGGFFGSLSFSPGGTWLAAMENTEGGGETTLYVWRSSDWDLQYTKSLGGCGYTFGLAFSPDGRTIALNVCEHLSLYRTSTGEMISSFPDEISSTNVIFSKDGNAIIAGTTSNRIRMIDIETQEVIKVYKTDGTSQILLSPDQERIAVIGIWDDNRQAWTTETWNIETQELESVIENVDKGVAFSSDGGQLSAINENEDLEFWDIETGTLNKTFSWTSTVDSISFGIFMPDENTAINVLMAGDKRGQVTLINPDTREMLQTINISTMPVLSVAIHPSGYILAAGVADDKMARIILYNVRTAQVVREIEIATQQYSVGVWGLAFSSDGQTIAAKTSPFYQIQAWNVNSGEMLPDPSKATWFNAVDIGGDSQGHLINLKFISTDGGYSGIYQISDNYTGEILASSLSIEETGICQEQEHYALSGDERYFAIGCDLFTLPLWDLKEQILAHNLKSHTPWVGDGAMGNITDIKFIPYGYLFASSGYDNTIKFWNAESGELLTTISEHSCRVTDIAFSLDGKYLASISCDGTLRLWGLHK